ncbi:CASP-like protein 1E1 [Oryza glaberrima]|nr:CASP-like protein 1E1 [Oryza glaberrima]
MESSRGKPGLNGSGGGAAAFDYSSRRGYYTGAGAALPPLAAGSRAPPVDPCCVALRVFVLLGTLASAVVMAADRQSTTVQIAAGEELAPPLRVPVTAKWTYSSAFVYFVVANAMVFAFSAAALAAVRRRSAVVPVMVGDLVAMALLFSAVGAAAQFGLLGERGNAHVRWAKVCDVYGPFCERAMAAVVVSLIAAFADLVLLMLTILTIHKASSYY